MKEKGKMIRELYSHSKETYQAPITITSKNNVIDASKVFKAKKKSDEWWNDALSRLNKINGLSNDR
jgi:hypothetical protein